MIRPAASLRDLLFAVCAALLATASALAQYTFKSIADSGPTFASFGQAGPAVNAAGTVVFYASLDAGPAGVFAGTGGPTATIALNTGPLFTAFNGVPTINDAGTVAFLATRDASLGGGEGIFTVTNGTTTTIVLTTGPEFSLLSEPAINAAGTVAFKASLDAGGTGIYSVAGGTTTPVALTTGPVFSTFSISRTAINTDGAVAFLSYRDTNAGGGLGIFSVAGGVQADIALSTSPVFSGFGADPSINAAGTVAFETVLEDFGEAIYVGNGGTATRVIGRGDPLFGSTVVLLAMGASGLNDLGQVAFRYTLANQVNGVALATVPEAGSSGLLILGALSFFSRRRGAR